MIKYYYKVLRGIENILNVLIIIFLKMKFISLKPTTYPKTSKKDKICLLGNGPSLSSDFEFILNEKRDGAKIMTVNLSIFTDFFTIVKPDFYILQDPAFFRSDVADKFIDMQKNITKLFIEKVTWEMKLILPPMAKNNTILKQMSENKNIKIFWREALPIIGGTNKFNNFLFRNNLATPLAQNVLIAGLFESLQMGYKNILLYGADHSWHENYTLGNDNVLYTEDRHFYGNDNIMAKAHVDEYCVPVRVHEEFMNLYRTFKIYDSLSSYAKSISAKVINKSSKTWIDSFDRN